MQEICLQYVIHLAPDTELFADTPHVPQLLCLHRRSHQPCALCHLYSVSSSTSETSQEHQLHATEENSHRGALGSCAQRYKICSWGWCWETGGKGAPRSGWCGGWASKKWDKALPPGWKSAGWLAAWGSSRSIRTPTWLQSAVVVCLLHQSRTHQCCLKMLLWEIAHTKQSC